MQRDAQKKKDPPLPTQPPTHLETIHGADLHGAMALCQPGPDSFHLEVVWRDHPNGGLWYARCYQGCNVRLHNRRFPVIGFGHLQ